MIDKLTIEQCCICMACSEICPVDAIKYTNYINGVGYPQIDYKKCIQCNRCEQVCPVNKEFLQLSINKPDTFVARSREKNTRIASTSGAVFFELAKWILKSRGYIYGAVFDSKFQVQHQLTNDFEIVKNMRGSKYVQSDIGHVYREIEKLVSDNMILFCGCPCQVAGLKRYLGKSYNNLILMDFVCHGIPSQKMFDEYRECLEKRYKSKIHKFQFRNKNKGWHNSSVYVEFENGKIYTVPITIDAYMRAFLSGTSIKECCFNCQFKRFKSGSDISVADFWGAEVLMPQLDDNTGLSAVFIHTEKGQNILKRLDIEKFVIDPEFVIDYNRNVIESTAPSVYRKQFLNLAEQYDYGKAMEILFRENFYAKAKRKSFYLMRVVKNKIQGKAAPLY